MWISPGTQICIVLWTGAQSRLQPSSDILLVDLLTCIPWISDFAFWYEHCLIDLHHTWDNGSVWLNNLILFVSHCDLSFMVHWFYPVISITYFLRICIKHGIARCDTALIEIAILTQFWPEDLSILNIWTSPFLALEVFHECFHFYCIFHRNSRKRTKLTLIRPTAP